MYPKWLQKRYTLVHPLNRTLPMCIWVNCSKSLQNFFKGALKYAFLVNKVGVNVEVHIKFHRDYQSHAKFSLGIPVQFPIPDHWGWLSDTTVTFSARSICIWFTVKKHNQKPTQSIPKTYGLATTKLPCYTGYLGWRRGISYGKCAQPTTHTHKHCFCVKCVDFRKPLKLPLYSWRRKISWKWTAEWHHLYGTNPFTGALGS